MTDPVPQSKNPPGVVGQVCERCDTRKAFAKYRMLTTKAPIIRDPVCLVCRQKEEDEKEGAEFKAAVREHKEQKLTGREKRHIETSRATDRARSRAKAELRRSAKLVADNDAAKELARRELARRALLQYILQFNPGYLPGWVHEDICRRLERFLEDVRAGKDPRLMLCMPPRHGKSTIASVEFPSWILGNHPQLEVMACSYGVSLPVKFSRLVRERLRDPQYQQIFEDTRVDPESQNVEGWATTAKGGFIPAGVGGGITGKGADVLIVDDPFKDAEEADSVTVRDSVWDWWGSTAYTRLSPKSGVVVINTRWNDDDLSGRLLAQMHAALKEIEEACDALRAEGATEAAIEAYRAEELQTVDQWEVISYPAIAEHDEYLTEDHRVVEAPEPRARPLRRKGDALHPARYDIKKLLRKKRVTQPRHWAALYQQTPVPDEGTVFTKQMIHCAASPDWRELPILISVDLAISVKQDRNYTVIGAGCIDYDDVLHVLAAFRKRMGTFEIVEAILDMYERFKNTTQSVTVGIEQGQIYLAIKDQLELRMRERKLYPSLDMELKPVTDKKVRAGPLQGQMQQARVCFPPGQPWAEQVVHELLRFPGGVFDDCVDMMSWMARMRARVFAPQRPKPKRLKSWKDKLNQYTKREAGAGSAMAA